MSVCFSGLQTPQEQSLGQTWNCLPLAAVTAGARKYLLYKLMNTNWMNEMGQWLECWIDHGVTGRCDSIFKGIISPTFILRLSSLLTVWKIPLGLPLKGQKEVLELFSNQPCNLLWVQVACQRASHTQYEVQKFPSGTSRQRRPPEVGLKISIYRHRVSWKVGLFWKTHLDWSKVPARLYLPRHKSEETGWYGAERN